MLDTDISYCLLNNKISNQCPNCKRNIDNYTDSEFFNTTQFNRIRYCLPKLEQDCKMFLELKNEN